MNKENTALKARPYKRIALAGLLMAGVAGYAIGNTGALNVTPSYAEAVKLEAPVTFSFADVVEAVSPAVVSVRVESSFQPANHFGNFRFDRRDGEGFGLEEFFRRFQEEDFFGRGDKKRGKNPWRNAPRRYGQSQGSGFFVSGDGYLVTNHHVIENGEKFTVTTHDGKEHEATLVGADTRTDLAVLKIQADKELTYVDFGDTRPRIGEWVVAVGNPFGLGGTVTAGIVSAHGREIASNQYDDFIQIDAAVNKGNSGGPAFNLKGEVIGVNTAIFSPSGGNVGIAFAIPASLADEVVDDLIANGNVVRGWLGVQIQPVTEEISDALGLEFTEGAIVASPQEGSPADKAGIRSGDIITAVDGKKVKGPRELARTIGDYDPETEVRLEVWRDGEPQEITVTLGKLDSAGAIITGLDTAPSSLSQFGIEVENIGGDSGVVVRNVESGSGADKKGIRSGDVIVSVNGEDIANISDLERVVEEVLELGRKAALFQIKRNDNTTFIPVPVERG